MGFLTEKIYMLSQYLKSNLIKNESVLNQHFSKEQQMTNRYMKKRNAQGLRRWLSGKSTSSANTGFQFSLDPQNPHKMTLSRAFNPSAPMERWEAETTSEGSCQ